MHRYLLILPILLLAGCTPPEVEYCRAKNVGPAGLENCTQHYFEQENAFQADRAVCSAQADITYPQSLYSGWGTALVHNRYRGGFSSVEQISVPPDYARNAEVDALRMRIIEPCMQERGWNSGHTWQAGRTPVSLTPSGALPWARK